MKITFFVEDGLGEICAEHYLRVHKGVSRRLITKLKRVPNGITRNGALLRTVDTVQAGDTVVLNLPDMQSDFSASDNGRTLDILFEDDYLCVINKPADMPVHPSHRHRGDTLSDLFLKAHHGIAFHAVNRLDKDTSGLCVVAKDSYTTAILQTNGVEKTYYAICEGTLDEKQGTVDAPIAREQESIIKRVVRDDGQRAITHYKVLKESDSHSLLEIRLETGRTHQIRVHFSHIGHPLAGDDLYGGSRDRIKRQALHCGKISFLHPMTNKKVEICADMPIEMTMIMHISQCTMHNSQFTIHN